MFAYIFITLLLSGTALSQINGEFWWLHEKVGKLQQVEAPPPKFDDVNEFETDESSKVIFKDNELNTGETNDFIKQDMSLNKGETLSIIRFQDQSELSVPNNLQTNIFINNKNNINTTVLNEENANNNVKSIPKKEDYILTEKPGSVEDEFIFVFPENNEILWEDKVKQKKYNNSLPPKDLNNKNKKVNKPSIIIDDKVWFEEETKIQPESESICTFITKQDCIRNKGITHMSSSCPKKAMSNDNEKICCILPLASRFLSKINEPSNYYGFIKRYKRSDPNVKLNAALKQRNALLDRKFHIQSQESKLTATTDRIKPAHKIVTPEYVDPYWNVKNLKFRNPGLQNSAYYDYQNTKYDDGNDYIEQDYAVELPKPGLVGLYSDNENSRGHTSWKAKNKNRGSYYGGEDEVSEEDSGEPDLPFGYSTFDPRLGDRVSTDVPKPIKRKPQRKQMMVISTSKPEDDIMTHSESQTISFQSTPDFHVLQGFKLVNLAGNKNRYVRKTTTGSIFDDERTLPPVKVDSIEDYIDGIDLDQQIYKNCGKVTKNSALNRENCDFWLAVAVLTKSPQSILCYATIVHPRAAVTAAECVHGKAPGEITIISGVWDLKVDKEESQSRMASVHSHLQYKPGELANDLAILHWKRPLRLDPRIQPACLSDPHVGDSCYFAGWGGYDQALQSQPKWQRATILTPRTCNEKVSAPDIVLPAGAFCASVDTRGTVTGVGGPLLCKNSDRISIVGVAVYRESIVVLLPAFDWIVTALRDLQIN